ncbi:MAG: hypothetical protein ABIY55_29110 [Kofleriaceae bacterium]
MFDDAIPRQIRKITARPQAGDAFVDGRGDLRAQIDLVQEERLAAFHGQRNCDTLVNLEREPDRGCRHRELVVLDGDLSVDGTAPPFGGAAGSGQAAAVDAACAEQARHSQPHHP